MSRSHVVLEYATRHSDFPQGRLAEMVTQLDDPGDYGAVLRLLGRTRTWQAAADPRLKMPVDGDIVSRTVVTNPWRNDPREALADAQDPGAQTTDNTGQSEQYRRATDILATLVAIWSDSRPHDAQLVHRILAHILLKVRSGHDEPTAITGDDREWGIAEAERLVARACAAAKARDEQNVGW